MNKRMVFFLVFVLVLGVFITGTCSRQPSGSAASAGAAVNAASAPKEQLQAAIPQLNPSPDSPALPLAKEKTKLTVLARMHALSTDLAALPLLQKMEEETNVVLEGGYVSPSAWNERKNLILAGGQLPDVILSGLNKADIVTYGSQGMFIPLNDLIDKYAPNIKALYAKYPQFQAECVAPDGNQYYIKGINGLPFRESGCNLFINTNWLNKLGLAKPTTYDEFYNVLKAFKTRDPNGNGLADEIPFSAIFANGMDYNMLFNLFSGWGFTMGGDYMTVDANGRILLAPMHPNFPEALKYFNKLYKEGLIDQEIFTLTNANLTAKGKSSVPVLGSYPDWFGDPVVGSERFNQEYDVLEPMQGPYSRLWRRVSGFGSGGTAVITSSCQDPELAIKWIDYCYRPEISLQLSRGQIGEVLELRDGTFYSKPAPQGMSDDEFRLKYCPDLAFSWALTPEILQYVQLPLSFDRKIKKFFPANKPYLPEKYIPDLMYSKEESDEMSFYAADIQSYINKTVPQFITGQLDIDANTKDFVNQLEKMGALKYAAVIQASYDRYVAAQK
jgi:putative aldouronate transport system substrate-binding protein